MHGASIAGGGLKGLSRLKKAVNVIKVANRLSTYKKPDTGRKPEEARKKAEKKQLRQVWKSVSKQLVVESPWSQFISTCQRH